MEIICKEVRWQFFTSTARRIVLDFHSTFRSRLEQPLFQRHDCLQKCVVKRMEMFFDFWYVGSCHARWIYVVVTGLVKILPKTFASLCVSGWLVKGSGAQWKVPENSDLKETWCGEIVVCRRWVSTNALLRSWRRWDDMIWHHSQQTSHLRENWAPNS